MSPADSGRRGFIGNWWRRTNPWLRWVYLGFGMLCFVGYIMAATKVRTRRFVRAAVLSVVFCAVGIACAALAPPSEEIGQNATTEQDRDLSADDIPVGITVAIWIGLSVYGYMLNREYERLVPAIEDRKNPTDFRAPHSGTGSVYPPFGAPPPHPPFGAKPAAYPGASSAPPADALRAEADRVLAIQPLGNEPASTPPNTPDS